MRHLFLVLCGIFLTPRLLFADMPLLEERMDAITYNQVFHLHECIGPSPEFRQFYWLEHRFAAIIFWRQEADGDWYVVDWRWAVHTGPFQITPEGEFALEWEEEGRIRRITAPHLLNLCSAYDWEVKLRPLNRRVGLRKH